MKKIYTVYKTTNLINGTIYIGVHKTSNMHDTYIGSGKLLKNAIKKYGRDNFSKEILYTFDNPKDAYSKEFELVNELFILDESNYNLALGGIPTTDFYPNRRYLTGENHPMWGKKQSEESNKKRSQTQTGRKMTPESSIKKSISLKGHKSWNKGKRLSDGDKLNKSIAAKKLEKIECPHCGKLNDPGNSKKWHFDRCKSKSNID